MISEYFRDYEALIHQSLCLSIALIEAMICSKCENANQFSCNRLNYIWTCNRKDKWREQGKSKESSNLLFVRNDNGIKKLSMKYLSSDEPTSFHSDGHFPGFSYLPGRKRLLICEMALLQCFLYGGHDCQLPRYPIVSEISFFIP